MNGAIFRSVFWRELRGAYLTPIAWVFTTGFLLIAALLTFFVGGFFEKGEATLSDTFFRWIPLLMSLFAPALGMRVWSNEIQGGTVDLVNSWPVRLSTILLAKFFATWAALMGCLALTFPFVWTVSWLGDPDFSVIFTGYAGAALVGACFIAISCAVSAFCRSQVIAFVFSAVMCLALVFLGAPRVSNEAINLFPQHRSIVDAISNLAIAPHYDGFRKGLVSHRSWIYFFSLIVACWSLNWFFVRRLHRGALSGWKLIPATLIIAASFIFVNFLFLSWTQKKDYTEDRIYTLSEDTKSYLTNLSKPVTLRYYVSSQANVLPIELRSHAAHVRELLQRMVETSKGQLILEELDPQPDSDAEQAAQVDELKPHNVAPGVDAYLGLSATCLDQTRSIPFLNPVREINLEFDIVREIQLVVKKERKKVAIYSTLPVFGREGGLPPWAFIELLNEESDLIPLKGNEKELPEELDLLVVITPEELQPDFEKCIERYVCAGGSLAVFFDPLSISKTFYNESLPPRKKGDAWFGLRKVLGLSYKSDQVLLDMTLKEEVDRGDGPELLNFFLGLDETEMLPDHPITNGLSGLKLPFAGGFLLSKSSGLSATPLLRSTENSQLRDRRDLIEQSKEMSVRMLEEFQADERTYALAVLFEGNIPSWTGSKIESKRPAKIFAFSDADLLADPFAGVMVENQGRMTFRPSSGNLDFVWSAFSYLQGASSFSETRSRGQRRRPLTRLEEMRQEAEQEHQIELDALQERKNQLFRESNPGQMASGVNARGQLNRDILRRRELMKEEEKGINEKLRVLRRDHRLRLNRMESRLKWLNTGLLPGLVAILGCLIVGWRHHTSRAGQKVSKG